MSHDELESVLGAYALDAVGEEEAAAVEAHLRSCPRCRAEVDAFRELAARLGTSAALAETEAEPPSPALWDRIAEGLDATPRRPATPMPELDGGPASVVPLSAARSWDARAGRGRRARARRWAPAVVAAAAVVAAVVLGVNLSQTNGQLSQARQALASRGSQAAVSAALADPSHQLVQLDSARGTRLAEFVVLPDGQGYMVSTSMPSLPGDETYQLWAMISGQPISMGLLGSNPRHAAFTVAPSAAPTELAVTVEPAGGVTTPDRSPVATGRLSPA